MVAKGVSPSLVSAGSKTFTPQGSSTRIAVPSCGARARRAQPASRTHGYLFKKSSVTARRTFVSGFLFECAANNRAWVSR